MRTDQSIAFDHYLVTAARLGDKSALGRLAQLWQPKLLRHAQRLLGEEEAAREATQDSWLEILRGLPGLREARAFPAWAYRIVSRRCAGSVRQRQGRRQRDVAETFDDVASTTGSPEQSASADELHARHRMRVLLQGESP